VPPTAEELALLEGDMRQILAECRRFEHREKTPAQTICKGSCQDIGHDHSKSRVSHATT
jgi:hypothetical protein